MFNIQKVFADEIVIENNYIFLADESSSENQAQTNKVFSEKWTKSRERVDTLAEFQKKWYLELYGFNDEKDLSSFLRKKKVIFDAGCGLGYKAAWFAELAPESTVIGMDFSEAANIASQKYNYENLYFCRGDIAHTGMKEGEIDYVSCDQVIHHTENPEETFKPLSSLLASQGEFACYVYKKKALPRELLDDYFRDFSKTLSNEELWELAEQVTELGRRLDSLDCEIDVPEIPALGIKEGRLPIQRFIYWNFMKCFWNKDLGKDISVDTNFDWYSPSNAYRYTKEEFLDFAKKNNLETTFLHEEDACYSGRFLNK